MFSYITKELPALLAAHFPQLDMSRQSIAGHSMGGHGAFVCALKNPGHYKSVSAFAPICNPSTTPWGTKTFVAYLGADTALWKEYDSCELATKYKGPYFPILVHQGDKDKWLETHLSYSKFETVLKGNHVFIQFIKQPSMQTSIQMNHYP